MKTSTQFSLKSLAFVKKQQYLLWIALFFVGIVIRIKFLPLEKGDYICFLEPWMNFAKSHGYFSSLKYNFYNYTPSYIYFLIFATKIGLNPVFSVKVFSFIFEFIAAFYIGKIATIKSKSNMTMLIALAVVPILPSVVLNASYLSQCDSIYTAFVLGSCYYILINKQFLSVVFLGLAFMLKMQAVMILPFFFVMLLREKIKWYYFLIIPMVYILSILPAWLYGRSFSELLGIYISQASNSKDLTLHFPNLYIWINNDYYEVAKNIGILITVLLTLLAGFWLSQKRFVFNLELWVKLAFLSAIIVPFILPGMHERYMYVGDVMGVLYYLVLRKNIHLPIGIALVSFYSYVRCSRYNEILPMEPAFFIYLAVIIFTSIDFISSLKNSTNEIITK